MKKITAGYNQSVIDIAIQEYGDASGVKQILDANPILTINSVIEPGSVIYISESPINNEVVQLLQNNNLKPATSDEDYIYEGDYDHSDYSKNDYK